MKRGSQKTWFFEYYFGEFDKEMGYTGSTDSTDEWDLQDLMSVSQVLDIIQDSRMSVELKVYIPMKMRGSVSFDEMEILHAEIGSQHFCDGKRTCHDN